VISRFPTDNAIYVEEDKSKLSVEFLERVFMKNKASYKAVVYKDASLNAGFWNGQAIDKQLNNPSGEVSNYWILDFLSSRLTVTATAGTRRLAIAMLAAIKKSDLKIKQEIIAAAITTQDIVKCLVKEEEAENFETARRMRTVIGKCSAMPCKMG
jgi:hypothetical protein